MHIFDRLRDGRSGLLSWHPSTFTNGGQNPYDFERAESVLLELDRIVKRVASMAEPPDQVARPRDVRSGGYRPGDVGEQDRKARSGPGPASLADCPGWS